MSTWAISVADRDTVRERHYRFFLTLARRHGAQRAIHGPDRSDHIRRLDRDRENVDAALDWAMDQDSADPALELSAALDEYWMVRHRFADAVDRIEGAVGKAGADRAPELRVIVLCRKAWALWPLGRKPEQAAVMVEAEATARALGDPAVISRVLTDRAFLEISNNRPDVASALADESLSCAEASGDRWALAGAAWARAVASPSGSELRERVETAASLLEAAGNVFHTATLFEMAITRALGLGLDRDAGYFASRAVPLIRALDYRYLWMHLQRAVGPAALFTGDVDGARAAYRELLALSRDLVVLPAAAWGLSGLAAVAAERDDLDRAARLAGAAVPQRYDEPQDPVDARLHATFLVPARARRGPDAWDAAFREGEAMSFEDAIGYALADTRPGARRSAQPPAAAIRGAA